MKRTSAFLKGRGTAWALCAAWMTLIFAMSSMPGDVSGQQSGTVVKIVLDSVSLLFGEEAASAVQAQALEHLVRKGAHMAEYAVLFLLLCRALRLNRARRPALYALLFSAAYAATDELHQCLTPGRGPSPVDVMIDTAGAALAFLFRALWLHIWARGRRDAV